MIQTLEDYPGGYVIRCDKHGQNFASADIARLRLKAIIKADREAVPTGRYVIVSEKGVYSHLRRIVRDGRLYGFQWTRKPVFRWERRR